MTSPVFQPSRPQTRQSADPADHFLLARAVEDIVDFVGTPRGRCAIVGRSLPALEDWLADADGVTALDPRPLQQGDPAAILGDPAWRDGVGAYELVLAIGLFDRCNDPALAAAILGGLLAPGGRLVGVAVGGESLSTLRAALIDADRATGKAAMRIHPMLDGSGLAGILAAAGLRDPVVTVDRVNVRYPSARRLVGDLRAMGCSRRLVAPTQPLTKRLWSAVEANVAAPFTERFDLLHFHALKAEG